MTTRKQSLAQALKLISAGEMHSVHGLTGCPVGGWAETQQAMRRLIDDLPRREERSYTVDDLIHALYVVDHADRYQPRA